jgi:hypothetical protein
MKRSLCAVLLLAALIVVATSPLTSAINVADTAAPNPPASIAALSVNMQNGYQGWLNCNVQWSTAGAVTYGMLQTSGGQGVPGATIALTWKWTDGSTTTYTVTTCSGIGSGVAPAGYFSVPGSYAGFDTVYNPNVNSPQQVSASFNGQTINGSNTATFANLIPTQFSNVVYQGSCNSVVGCEVEATGYLLTQSGAPVPGRPVASTFTIYSSPNFQVNCPAVNTDSTGYFDAKCTTNGPAPGSGPVQCVTLTFSGDTTYTTCNSNGADTITASFTAQVVSCPGGYASQVYGPDSSGNWVEVCVSSTTAVVGGYVTVIGYGFSWSPFTFYVYDTSYSPATVICNNGNSGGIVASCSTTWTHTSQNTNVGIYAAFAGGGGNTQPVFVSWSNSSYP